MALAEPSQLGKRIKKKSFDKKSEAKMQLNSQGLTFRPGNVLGSIEMYFLI